MELNTIDTVALLVVFAAAAAYVNHRWLRLPFTIGLLIAGLVASLCVLGLHEIFPKLGVVDGILEILASIDFSESLLHGMLGFLLFAGSLHLNFEDLWAKKGPVLVLASVGLLISTALIGFAAYWIFGLFGYPLPILICLLFGALISPTDPIAVLGLLKKAGAPKSVETKIAGESLFNDGFAVVLFTLLLAASGFTERGATSIGAADIAWLFGQEVLGGVLLGLVAGYLVYRAMKTLDEPNLEILLSLALVMGIIFVGFQLHVSVPLACVVAGLFIGNQGRTLAMSDGTRDALDLTWSFIDEALNAVLFLLVGLEIVVVSFNLQFIFAGLVLIPVGILARYISVWVSINSLRMMHDSSPGVIRILTWGGLKGGISIALALSLPAMPGRSLILTATYILVVFSLLGQGLTIKRALRGFSNVNGRSM